MSDKIKFGTDGWRAIIAKDFTVYNVARVSKALADWLKQKNATPKSRKISANASTLNCSRLKRWALPVTF